MKKSLENQTVSIRKIHTVADENLKWPDLDASRESNVVATAMLVLLSVVAGMVIMQLVRSCGAPRPAAASMQIADTDCRFCHLPAPARTLKEYDKRIRKYRAPVKPVDLKELL
jgi:hypothetical protein